MKTTLIYLLVGICVVLLGCQRPEKAVFYKYAPGSAILNGQEQMQIEVRPDGTAIFKGESSTNKASIETNKNEIIVKFPAYQQVGLNGATLVFVKENNDLILKESPKIRFTLETDK